MPNIKDTCMSPTVEITKALIDIDGSLVLSGKDLPELKHNHAFFWMVETWLKRNEIAYQVDRTQNPYTSEYGIRVFGKEVSDIDWFIQNLE